MAESVLADLKDAVPTKDDRRIMHFQFRGYVILLGQNSFSNERMITEHPHRDCIWMHALAARGSHLILCVNQKPEPPHEVLSHAAFLALKYSKSEARTVNVAYLKDLVNFSTGVYKPSRSTTMEVE